MVKKMSTNELSCIELCWVSVQTVCVSITDDLRCLSGTDSLLFKGEGKCG